MRPAAGDITILLSEMESGNQAATAAILELLYDELRRLAAALMKSERSNHTLQPTALVHEAYLRLAGKQGLQFQNRAHFLALAANAMRRILVEYARGRKADKRGGALTFVELSTDAPGISPQIAEVLDVDQALNRLADMDPRLSQVVELRYFGGLSAPEVAEALDVSEKTVLRDWSIAKAWLRTQLGAGEDDSGRVGAN